MLSPLDLQPAIEAALRDHGLAARVVDGWLELTTELPVDTPNSTNVSWRLLSLNARVRGGVCLFAQSDGRLRLRGEIRTDRAIDERVSFLCEDLHAARDIVCRSDTCSIDPPPGEDPCEAREVSRARLAELCAEAGWPPAPLDSSKVRVAIVNGVSEFHAHMSLDRCGNLVTVVPLVESPVSSAISREAIAWLLLQLPSGVYGVKGLVHGEGDDGLPAIAATTERGAPTADAVGCALSALTVACQLVGREARALVDETLAGRYLLRQRFSNSQLQEMPCLQLA